jgi:lauroyl/myristoyl acyltransferase
VGLAQWEFEVGDEIPTWENGGPRPIEDITADMNRAFEQAILRDVANWFWVHRRWKPYHQRRPVTRPKAENGEQASTVKAN